VAGCDKLPRRQDIKCAPFGDSTCTSSSSQKKDNVIKRKRTMRPFLSRALAAVVALGFAAGPAAAQTDDYPRRPITLISSDADVADLDSC
jgi:hypothetical protein